MPKDTGSNPVRFNDSNSLTGLFLAGFYSIIDLGNENKKGKGQCKKPYVGR